MAGSSDLLVVRIFAIMTRFHPEPPADRSRTYYDEPVKAGIILAMIWAVVGMFVGDWVTASGLSDLTLRSRGRALTFAPGSHDRKAVLWQRADRHQFLACSTSRVRLAGTLSPLFVLWGYNLFLPAGRDRLFVGHQSIRIAEPGMVRRYLVGIVWADLFCTCARWRGRAAHLSPIGTIWPHPVVAVLHIVNGLCCRSFGR